MNIIKIELEGETWNVLSVGAERDGKTFCHLAHPTRGRLQRNGFVPAQIGEWVPTDLLQTTGSTT